MNGYVVLLLAAVMCGYFILGAEAGCKERGQCCKGKDNTCKALGPRMNGKSSKTCFCDESCLFLGDCCTDFRDVCKEVDCVTGEFENWGECSSSCGVGVKSRKRPILREPRNGGKQCENIEEKIYCYGNKCKVARHSSGHREVRETGKIIPAEFGEWRASKKFDPYKDIRRNLFNHYSANEIIRRPSYCATFEISESKAGCVADFNNPWGSYLQKGSQVCVECQPFAMKKSLGVRCKGHGVFMKKSRWNAVTLPGCDGRWEMKTRHRDCSCPVNKKSSYILI